MTNTQNTLAEHMADVAIAKEQMQIEHLAHKNKDMFAALKLLQAKFMCTDNEAKYDECWDIINNAIAKAEGNN